MKIIVDKAKCTGHARCAGVAPEVYRLDESGYNAMGEAEVPDGLQDKARRGARACPEGAIRIVEDIG